MPEYKALFNMYLSKSYEAKDPDTKKCFKDLATKTALQTKVEALRLGNASMLEMSEQMLECV